MNKHFPTFAFSNGTASGFAALQRELQQRWQRLPAGVRSPVGPVILATLVILGLLLVFHQVVRGAVQQSELRHKATALHAEATWRCNSLRSLGESSSCLLLLNAAAYGGARLPAQDTP